MGFCDGGDGILKVGRVTDFQAHQIEHQLGAYTDCNHGQGLAVIQPVYYRHILKDAEEKFTRFAKAVFGADTAEGRNKSIGRICERMRFSDEDRASWDQMWNHRRYSESC